MRCNVVWHYAVKSGVAAKTRVSPHVGRATAATNALDHEADIAKVQEWLGHANIATTGSTIEGVAGRRIVRRTGWIISNGRVRRGCGLSIRWSGVYSRILEHVHTSMDGDIKGGVADPRLAPPTLLATVEAVTVNRRFTLANSTFGVQT